MMTNRNHQTQSHIITQVMLSGKMAYRNGKQLTDNPYIKGSAQHDAWEAGWELQKHFTKK